MVTLTQNEVTALVGAFPDRWQPFVSMLVGSGMRFGEITALPVAPCDLDADLPTVRVRQAWKATGLSARELGAPKDQESPPRHPHLKDAGGGDPAPGRRARR